MSQASATERGSVALVGAGPGDYELLTLKALRQIEAAEVVVYDNLVGQEILDLIPPTAERLYVGKKAARHSLPQEEINQLLVSLAKAGKRVVRLKGGDPFVFGRGGEEAEALAAESIPFAIVPGITSASGIGAYAGIPLTHRDFAQSCVFVTGHLKEGGKEVDWASLTNPNQTLVIYMGITRLDEICRQLLSEGMPPDTPAAIVCDGTLKTQSVITAQLDKLARVACDAGVTPPALIVIGQVVSLHKTLAWFPTQHLLT